jgi:hypothetical protein
VHVYNENNEEYLSQVKTPYMQIRLCQIYDLEYSYVDMDSDGYEELIIFSGDTFILRFRQGKVYLYSFISPL